MGGSEILIVEDETIVGLDIEKKLKSLGYEVLGQASSGEEAIQKAGELKPNLVLMDIKLKGELDGIDAAHKIKSRFDIPVIFITAYADEQTIKRVTASNSYGYILKPINKRELHTGVEMALYRHQTEIQRKKSEQELKNAYDKLEHRVKARTAELLRINGQLKQEIEERKQAEKDRESMRQQLIQSQTNQAIATLAAGIAHNFNNALAGIAGNIDLLQLELKDCESVMKFSEPMRASIQQMANLTNQLLAYARGGNYQPQVIFLKPFIDAALLLIQYRLGSNIQIITDFSDASLSVKADMTQMQMVLSSILSNAAEAMSNSGRIHIMVNKIKMDQIPVRNNDKLEGGPYASISIQDEGIGMESEICKRIFEPFFTTKIRGRGLSMAAVYGIIQNHHGTISVDSEPGKGTKVSIYLPLIPAPIEESPKPETQIVTGTGTVLLIEDEDSVIEVTRKLLEKLGYHVLIAKTGRSAERIIHSYQGYINLVILDIELPDLPGAMVYSLVKKVRPELKVLVNSGYALDGPVQELLNLGADDFIQKPFTIQALSEKLQTLMNNKKS